MPPRALAASQCPGRKHEVQQCRGGSVRIAGPGVGLASASGHRATRSHWGLVVPRAGSPPWSPRPVWPSGQRTREHWAGGHPLPLPPASLATRLSTILRGAVGNGPSSLDWLGLAVCPVGARFNGTTIGWHESPPSRLAKLIGEAGFGSILSYRAGGTTKQKTGG